MKLRKIFYGLLTVFGIRKLGYFIPYRYAGQVNVKNSTNPWLLEWFSKLSNSVFLETLKSIQPYTADLKRIAYKNNKFEDPRWGQDWFPGLDAVIAYGLVRVVKPATIIEVGSGHSTRFLVRAINDEKIKSNVVCIDPQPRAALHGLDINFIKLPIQQLDLKGLPALQKGDILFIDSSHICVPGSDVDLIVNRILPGLPSGVFIHFHDIFLPDPYPEKWGWREYNEQLIISALLAGKKFNPIFSSYFIRNYAPQHLRELGFDWIRVPPGSTECSLWLEKR
jgi:hypothetical protein